MSRAIERGQVTDLLILEEGAKILSTPVERVEVTEGGFRGDRHAGLTRPAGSRDGGAPAGTEIPNRRQVSLVSEEELAEIAARLQIPEVRPQWLGANLCVRGIEGLSALEPDSRLVFAGGVQLAVTGENQPCREPGEAIADHYPDREKLAAHFPKAAIHLRGLVGWVKEPGAIRVGEAVEVRPPEAEGAG